MPLICLDSDSEVEDAIRDKSVLYRREISHKGLSSIVIQSKTVFGDKFSPETMQPQRKLETDISLQNQAKAEPESSYINEYRSQMLRSATLCFESVDSALDGLTLQLNEDVKRMRILEDEEQRKIATIRERERQERLRKHEEELAEKERHNKLQKEREAEEIALRERQKAEALKKERIERKKREKAAQNPPAEKQSPAVSQGITNSAHSSEPAQQPFSSPAVAHTPGPQGASQAKQEYEKHMVNISRMKTEVNAPVSSDKQLKSRCFDIKTRIRPRIGQLTPSNSQLKLVKDFMVQIFDEAKSFGPIVYQWTLNMYSKFIVQQAESETNVAVESALPLAMLNVLLWVEFPELGPILLARFVKKCPYVIGFSTSISTESGRKMMGYRRSGNIWESDESYSERMAGITAVWAVMTQSKLSVKSQSVHPYPVAHSWIFVSRLLNIPLEEVRNVHFSCIASWWDVCASRFLVAYGCQAEKLLQLASETWPEALSTRKYPAAARLRLLGKDWHQQGGIKPAWKPLGP